MLISHVRINSSSSLFCILMCTLHLRDRGFCAYIAVYVFLNGSQVCFLSFKGEICKMWPEFLVRLI